MKNILGLFCVLCSSVSFGQYLYNADQIKNGTVHQYFPLTVNSVPYVDASGNAQSTTLAQAQFLAASSTGTIIPTIISGGRGITVTNSSGVTTVSATDVITSPDGTQSAQISLDNSSNLNIQKVSGAGNLNMRLSGNMHILAPYALNMDGTAQVFNSPDGNTAFGLTMQNGGTAYWWSQSLAWIDSPLKISGALDATGHQLNNVSDGTLSTDAATFGQLTTTNAAVTANTTALNGWSMPDVDAISTDQVLKPLSLIGKTTQWASDSAGSITEVNTTVVCEFNAGSTTGTTDFTATMNFKKIGNMVYIEVPEMGAVMPALADLRTALSASPACVPLALRPANTSYGFITTNSNSAVPLGASGSFQINSDGNIVIYYQNTASGFPSGVWGGTGFHQSPTTDSYIQQVIYSLSPGTTSYTVAASNSNTAVTPSVQTWTNGTTTSLTYSVGRSAGYQLSTITDTCNGGSPGGSLVGTDYVITTVNRNCTVTAVGSTYFKAFYLDLYATGSLAAIPNVAYGVPNIMIFGFGDITTNTMPAPQLSALVTAAANEVTAANFLSIGGALTDHAAFVSVGFPTVISNILAQVTQINAAITPRTIVGIDLDLEGAGWNPTDIQTLITGFHGGGLIVSGAPQAYLSSGTNVNPATPTNLILTAGGGTGNTYGTALAAGEFDMIFVQTYNTGGWTVGGADESDPTFFQNIATALSNTILPSCAGVLTLCIQEGTNIVIGQVANASAGGQGPGAITIFNPTGAQIYPDPPEVIPSYNQNTILASFASSVTAGLDANPAIKGVMSWSMNNDYAPTLYQSTESATAGNFSDKIYAVAL